MAFHHDLLEQAEHLAGKEPRRPKQASLRRAASASYYALFHLLVDDAVAGLVRGPNPENLRNLLRRAFDHAEMRNLSTAFSGGTLPANLAAALGGPIPADLQSVAGAFLELRVTMRTTTCRGASRARMCRISSPRPATHSITGTRSGPPTPRACTSRRC